MVDARQSYGPLYNKSHGLYAPSHVSILVGLRLLTEDDVPWIYDLSTRRYPQYDAVTTEGWYRNVVLKTPLLFLPQRSENAFCISMLTYTPWLPAEHECTVVFICADEGAHWEALKLLRSSVEWSRNRRCNKWRISSNTDIDIATLARRLGAEEDSPHYSIKLESKQ